MIQLIYILSILLLSIYCDAQVFHPKNAKEKTTVNNTPKKIKSVTSTTNKKYSALQDKILKPVADSDESITISKTKKTQPVSTTASLLLLANMDCSISFDGKNIGKAKSDELVQTVASIGKHLIICKSADGKDVLKREIEIISGEQQILNLDLISIRKARIEVATQNLIAEMNKGYKDAKVEKIVEYIKDGANPEVKSTVPLPNNNDGWGWGMQDLSLTPLHFAAAKNSKELFFVLMDLNPEIDVQSSFGITPLMIAIHFNSIDIARLLIKKQADVNIRTTFSYSPLGTAMYPQREEMVALLIENGANVNAVCEFSNGYVPLYIACYSGFKNIAKLLIDKGADKNGKNQRGESPLFHLAGSGNIEMVRFLISIGADIDLKNKRNSTPLYAAVESTNCTNCEYPVIEMIRLLTDNGANLNNENDDGATPLSRAVELMNSSYAKIAKDGKEIAKILIEKGADLYRKNKNGLTPFSLASKENKKLLLSFQKK